MLTKKFLSKCKYKIMFNKVILLVVKIHTSASYIYWLSTFIYIHVKSTKNPYKLFLTGYSYDIT